MKLDNHSGSINVMKGLLIDSKVDNNEAYMGIYDSSCSCGDEGVEYNLCFIMNLDSPEQNVQCLLELND